MLSSGRARSRKNIASLRGETGAVKISRAIPFNDALHQNQIEIALSDDVRRSGADLAVEGGVAHDHVSEHTGSHRASQSGFTAIACGSDVVDDPGHIHPELVSDLLVDHVRRQEKVRRHIAAPLCLLMQHGTVFRRRFHLRPFRPAAPVNMRYRVLPDPTGRRRSPGTEPSRIWEEYALLRCEAKDTLRRFQAGSKLPSWRSRKGAVGRRARLGFPLRHGCGT